MQAACSKRQMCGAGVFLSRREVEKRKACLESGLVPSNDMVDQTVLLCLQGRHVPIPVSVLVNLHAIAKLSGAFHGQVAYEAALSCFRGISEAAALCKMDFVRGTFSMGCPVHSDMILLRFALWYMISFACRRSLLRCQTSSPDTAVMYARTNRCTAVPTQLQAQMHSTASRCDKQLPCVQTRVIGVIKPQVAGSPGFQCPQPARWRLPEAGGS